MAAEKRSLYIHTISNDQDNISMNVLAVLNSNFFGTEFNLKRENIAVVSITYEFNLLGIKGPRKMRAYVPAENSEFEIRNVNLLILEKRLACKVFEDE
jgi:hypothetical protein